MTVRASLDYESSSSNVSHSVKMPISNDQDEEFGEQERSGFLGFYDSHRLSLLVLLTVIVLSPLAVYVGIQIGDSHPPQILKPLMTTTGVKTMSASELVASIAKEKRTVYWLGPITGDKYSDNIAKTGIDQISYLPENSVQSDSSQYDLRVTTYGNLAIYNAQTHPTVVGSEKSVTNNFGTKVQYDPALPNYTIIQFASKPEIVVIEYSAFQSESTLVDTAQTLALVK